MRVLVAEDDPHTRRGLVEILRCEGYQVVEAEDGLAAWEAFESLPPDFVCLDIMMPKMNGYDVCRRIRAARPAVPIVFLSAKSDEVDKVLGLELGADDFIVKPFGVKEVVARIRAITRRCFAAGQAGRSRSSFQMGDLQVYPSQLRARRGDGSIELSLRDVQILELLYRHAGEVVDRNTLFNHAWGEDYLPNSRTLDQHISQLRKRVEIDPKQPRLIRTVHGAGYRYEESST
jgi:DNA-binding response OmpR family regulator